jgi:hypothetical protein
MTAWAMSLTVFNQGDNPFATYIYETTPIVSLCLVLPYSAEQRFLLKYLGEFSEHLAD